ncbi:MAG: methylmalonyl-CoA mutase family protein [Solirubrobacteraceae bacterium]|nr:methylmalonyl-CoA mutase family protein [Solirubrobacteraceae bacterium]
MPEPLASDFPPVSTEEWIKAATAKRTKPGQPADDTPPPKDVPAGTTEDGLPLRWIYTREDALAADPAGVPGRAPFVRGGGPAGEDDPIWQIRQEHVHPDRAATRTAILEDLEGGATQVTLRPDRAARTAQVPGTPEFAATRGVDGTAISTADDVRTTLDGVYTDLAPVALDAGPAAPAAAAVLVAGLRREDGAVPAASLGLDPIGTLAAEGAVGEDPAAAVARAGRIAAEVADAFPDLRTLRVDTRAHVNAGATTVRELAIAVATGAAYLRAADDAGLEPARAARTIEFVVAVDARQFEQIAKLRALRRLWARVLELSGVPEDDRRSATFARTSDRMLAAVDPWTNMLRVTTAGFAAAVAGADGLTVAPFDAVVADEVGAAGPGGLGRRIARNTQLVLQEESGLRRVADPAGGSWFVEALTDEIARAAWTELQRIEGDGGALAVVTDGRWAEELTEAAVAREARLRRREQELTGVNAFPLVGDDKVRAEPADRAAIAGTEVARLAERAPLADDVSAAVRDADGSFVALVDAAAAGARIDELAAWAGLQPTAIASAGLPVRRDAAPFEALRSRARAAVPDAGQGDAPWGPTVFVAGLGPLAAHSGPATWAANFYGVGGFVARQSAPLEDPAAAGAAWQEAGSPPVAAIAFGRDADDDALRTAVDALRSAGARDVRLVQAEDDRAAAVGADGALRDGIDMVELLAAALDLTVGDTRPTTTDAEVAR